MKHNPLLIVSGVLLLLFMASIACTVPQAPITSVTVLNADYPPFSYQVMSGLQIYLFNKTNHALDVTCGSDTKRAPAGQSATFPPDTCKEVTWKKVVN